MQNAVNATESTQSKKPYDGIAQCEKIEPLAFNLVLSRVLYKHNKLLVELARLG